MIKFLKEYKRLKKENAELKKALSDPVKVVEKVLGREMNWFDPEKLDKPQKEVYYAAAQDALNNKTLQNEIKYIINDLVHFIAGEAEDWRQVRDTRFTILAFDLLEKRLREIENPFINEERGDEFEAV